MPLTGEYAPSPSDWSRRLAAAVVETDDHRAACTVHRTPRVATLLRAALEIVHVAGAARAKPLLEPAGRRRRSRARDANEIEAESVRLRLDPLFERMRGGLDSGV